MNYNEISNQIQKQADTFLTTKGLPVILSEYGRLVYFGSYKLRLMNRNDIDVALVTTTLNVDTVTQLIKELSPLGFNRHWVFDNTLGGCKTDPKHIVYETTYSFYNDDIPKNERWEIGIVLTTADILPQVTKLTNEVEMFSQQQKDVILRLKFELAQKYGEHKYTGTQVYKAVQEGIETVEDFINWLK